MTQEVSTEATEARATKSKEIEPVGAAIPIKFSNPDLQKILDESETVEMPPDVEVFDLIKCSLCGVEYPEFLKEREDRCRCSRAKALSEVELEEVDPYGTMRLNTMRGMSSGLGRSVSVAMHCIHQDRKQGLMMAGPPGIGKTHILVGACREALDAGRVAIWKNFASLVTQIQGSYSNYEGPDRTQIITDLAKHDIVILDDLGKERHSDDVASIAYEIFDTLYRKRRTIFCATNLTLHEIGRRYDLAVLDRIRHMTEFVEVAGESRRGVASY